MGPLVLILSQQVNSMNILDLWLPILVAGIAVHIACTIAWTVLPHHKTEWIRLPLGPLDDAMPAAGAEIGKQYVLTETGTDINSPDAKCLGTLILRERSPSMGENIAMTICYFLFMSTIIGYLCSVTMTVETPKLDIFRFTATSALMAYSFGGLSHVIWFRRRILLDMIDGLVYSLITGVVFATLWPAM